MSERIDSRKTFGKKPFSQKPFRKAPSKKAPAVSQGAPSRAAAALCVSAVREGRSLSDVLPLYTKDLDDRDRAFVQEIVFGTLRHMRLLSTTLNTLLEENLKPRMNVAGALIICAIYQIIFTRVPAHAVVAATVGACSLCSCRAYTGLVNAVLRRFLREGSHLVHSTDPCVEQSFPTWLYEELKTCYGEELTLDIMRNSNEHAPMYLRVENSRISTEDYLKELEKCSIEASLVKESPCTLLLSHPVNVFKLPFFEEGYVSVQDLAASLASPLLNLVPGCTVLDTCSAPGGKSAHILDICPSADLTCTDIDEKRLDSAKENLERLNRKAKFLAMDLSQSSQGLKDEYDRILVDAPCSGTGVIRRHPDIKWLRRKKDIDSLVVTQKNILDNAFSLLKSGGILVYTTCSILKKENEEQVRAFLDRHKDARTLPFDMNGQTVSSYQRLPGENGSDGFFYARFIKE
ncbi:MAG: 16S rRNA (cytosine(967)-C(5))-methyltransferase RsmB [Succinivibrio sp.]